MKSRLNRALGRLQQLIESDYPWLSLFILAQTILLEKAAPSMLERTEVGGEQAYWAEGALTYRLESGLPLEEAVRIAESLQP